MLLYTATGAPNPRRVAVFLAEKKLEVPTRWVSLRDGEQFGEELASKSPDRALPFLELPDGTVISESLAICRCLEALHPEPALFGRDAKEQGLVEMWLRKLELRLYQPTQDALRNSRKGFAGRALPGWREGLPQIAALVERSNIVAAATLRVLDDALEGRDFLVGEAPSMADVVAHTTLLFAQRSKLEAAADLQPYPRLSAWVEAMSQRPGWVE